MSTVTSLYVFTKDQIKELRILADQIPKPKKPSKGSYKIPVAFSPKDAESRYASYQPFWDYIHENGDYRSRDFHWHGIIMDRALIYLREKDIDLTKTQLVEDNEELAYLYFDKKTKDKFLKKLDPKSIDQKDLNQWLDEYHWGTEPEGIIDSIQHLSDCFQLIDDDHVVLLHTDYIAEVINSEPLKDKTEGVIKHKSIKYLCDTCGKRLTNNWSAAKRISDIPAEQKHKCGDEFSIITSLVGGKEVEQAMNTTYRMKGDCKAQATGCYRTPM